MIKEILKKINLLEQKKLKKLNDQSKLQKEIEQLDNDLKRFNTFKRDYEKLQNNFTDFITSKQDK